MTRKGVLSGSLYLQIGLVCRRRSARREGYFPAPDQGLRSAHGRSLLGEGLSRCRGQGGRGRGGGGDSEGDWWGVKEVISFVQHRITNRGYLTIEEEG